MAVPLNYIVQMDTLAHIWGLLGTYQGDLIAGELFLVTFAGFSFHGLK